MKGLPDLSGIGFKKDQLEEDRIKENWIQK